MTAAPTVLEALSEEEAYLWAILQDESGIDIAEFLVEDEEGPDGRFRAWPFQWPWWRDKSRLQIDQASRSVGKSNGVRVRTFAFPFRFPGNEMVVTAPEMNHLDALTDKIEIGIEHCRLFKEMLVPGRTGIKHRPFQINWANGARLIGRIPQRDGRGVKGLHPLKLELDEGQDYPDAGHMELIETVKRGVDDSQWRAHGVTTGRRNWFFKSSQKNSGWKVHRIVAMHRPNWSDEERQEKIIQYGGSDQDPDYRRNVWGEHGAATSPIFVLHKLMECTDSELGSAYNSDIFSDQRITGEMVEDNGGHLDGLIEEPFIHLDKKKYAAYWGGADIGMTLAPTELVVYGETKAAKDKEPTFDLLLRLNLTRVATDEQLDAILWAMKFYDLEAFGMDSTGVGLPLFQALQKRAQRDTSLKPFIDKIRPYNWSSKVVVDIDWQKAAELGITDFDELIKECGILANPMIYSTDQMRKLVDTKRMLLPWHDEILGQLQGQTYTNGTTVDGYGRRRSYSAGSFHIFDGMRMAIMCWAQREIEAMIRAHEIQKRQKKVSAPVLDQFI